jgi:hypothetical protein
MNYTPDVKAPRFRKTGKKTVVNEMLKHIKQQVFSAKYMDDEHIKSIILEFNNEVWNTVIEKRDGVELPCQIGHIFIGTCPMKKKKNIDFKTTSTLKHVIQHKNWESDNYLAKIFFTTFATKYKFKNNDLWGFEATRDFKRAVGKTYPANWKRYIAVDPKLKITNFFRKNIKGMKRAEIQEDLMKTYNEFEF